MLLLLLVAAFEPMLPLGPAAAMNAGTAHPHWQNAFGRNPALAASSPWLALGGGYWRPYGLEGVDQAGLSAAAGFERWAAMLGISQFGFDRYRERDFAVLGAFRAFPTVAVGAAAHLLTVTTSPVRTEAVVALDAGAAWSVGFLHLGVAANRFNLPRLANGDLLPATVRAGLSAEPLEDFAVALDAAWSEYGGETSAGFELGLLPQLKLRFGVGYPPLEYAAGLGVVAGPVEVDYAFRYHPQLRDSHILGLRFSWW